jgi:hypothetical protein
VNAPGSLRVSSKTGSKPASSRPTKWWTEPAADFAEFTSEQAARARVLKILHTAIATVVKAKQPCRAVDLSAIHAVAAE